MSLKTRAEAEAIIEAAFPGILQMPVEEGMNAMFIKLAEVIRELKGENDELRARRDFLLNSNNRLVEERRAAEAALAGRKPVALAGPAEHSAEWLRGAVAVLCRMVDDCSTVLDSDLPHITQSNFDDYLAEYSELLAAAEAREAGKLTKARWIEQYGGQAVLDAEGMEVVLCVDCDDSICHGWRVKWKTEEGQPTRPTDGRVKRDLSKLALIFSHNGYWRKNRGGYTNDIGRAGIYDREEAEQIAAGCGPEKGVQLCPVNDDHPVIVAEERDALRTELASLRGELAAAKKRAHQEACLADHQALGVDLLSKDLESTTTRAEAAEKELAAANEQRGLLEGYIVDAHFRAFGSRRYTYVDCRSACDLLVADITATQHERDAALLRATLAEQERDKDLAEMRRFQRMVIDLTHKANSAEAQAERLVEE